MEIPIINRILKNERKRRGLTQEKTANMIFKSLATIKRYDTGDIIPESVLQQFSRMLGLELTLLLELQKGENEKRNTNYYSELIEKYKNPNIVISPKIEPVILKNQNSSYDIKNLKIELLNYLNFKDEFLNTETTKEEKSKRIEKILSFIDFLYFQDIIKK